MNLADLEQHLLDLANPDVAIQTAKFFKTAKGDYAEAEQFLGIRVPTLRQHLRYGSSLSLDDLTQLLNSNWHELKHFAVLELVRRFEQGYDVEKSCIYQFYLNQSRLINNWDLVDCSAHKIVGAYLFDKDQSVLLELANSECLWQRRISMVACWWFIQYHELATTFKLASILLNDSEDLMHKAVGWMLRETGKKDRLQLYQFLKQHYLNMPRTTLRYAIEHFELTERKRIMQGIFSE